MMRHHFEQQLETLHNSLIYMGALCEDAIACATKALLTTTLICGSAPSP